MFKIKGKITFDPINKTKKHEKQSQWKKTALVEFKDDTYKLYAWFIDKTFGIKLNKPLRGSHFTIINDIVDDDIYLEAKKIFKDKEITLFLDTTNIKANDKGHWWIKVYSDDAQNIRNVMGLGKPYFGFHFTIGLATHDQLEQSEYIRTYQTKGFKEANDFLIRRYINKGILKYENGKFLSK